MSCHGRVEERERKRESLGFCEGGERGGG